MLPQDSAWVAGFLDGEGCIHVVHTREQRYLRVSAPNTHLPSLEHLRALVGGSIYPKKVKEVHQDAWEWNVAGTTARDMLREIVPYMVTKRQEALIAQEFPISNHMAWHDGKRGMHPLARALQEECSKALRRLHHGIGAFAPDVGEQMD